MQHIKTLSPPFGTLCSLLMIFQLFATMPAMGDPPAISPQEAAERKPLLSIGEASVGAPVTCFSLVPTGDVMALGGDDGKIRLWSLTTNKLVRTIAAYEDQHYIGCIAYSPDGKRLAFQADDEPVRLWNLEKDGEVSRGAEKLSVVDQFCFSPDGKLLGMVTEATCQVWNVDTGKTWKSDQPVRSIAFSPDGKTLAMGFNTLRLVEAESGRGIKEIGKMDGSVTSLKFHPSGGQLLVTDGACPGTTVRILDIVTGKGTLFGSKIPLERVGATYSPDGKTIVVSDAAKHAIFWDVASGSKVGILPGIYQLSDTLMFSPDGKSLFAAITNQQLADVQIWDASAVLRPKNATEK